MILCYLWWFRRWLQKNETILIQMPQDQFKDVFGSDVKYWKTLYKGEKVEYLRLGYKIHSNCFYLTKIDCLDIIATDVNIYRIIEEHDQVQKNLTSISGWYLHLGKLGRATRQCQHLAAL